MARAMKELRNLAMGSTAAPQHRSRMKRGISNEEQATVALLPYVISASLGTRVCYRRALAKNVAQKRHAVAAHRCACARVLSL